MLGLRATPWFAALRAGAAGEVVATELLLAAFATGPGGALPVFSGRREMNSARVLATGTGEVGEAVQGRLTAVLDTLQHVAAGQTLIQFHDAIIANSSQVVGSRTAQDEMISPLAWAEANAGFSVTTLPAGNNFNWPSSGTYLIENVDFTNHAMSPLSGAVNITFINCRFGGDYGASIQYDFGGSHNVRIYWCDIAGPEDGTGPSLIMRRRAGAGSLHIVGCDVWGFYSDGIKLSSGDKFMFNRVDSPTMNPPGIAVWDSEATYQIGDTVVAVGADPRFAAVFYENTVADNTTSPDFAGSPGNNLGLDELTGWIKSNPHSDLIGFTGNGGSIDVIGNVLNGDWERRFAQHPSGYTGGINGNIWMGDQTADFTGSRIIGNLMTRHPDPNGGNPLGQHRGVLIAFNRIETISHVADGFWLRKGGGPASLIQGNTNPADSEGALTLNNGGGGNILVSGTDATVIDTETAETGDTMKARDAFLAPELYQGSWTTIATIDGEGDFEGWITGAPRAHHGYRSSVRYAASPAQMATSTNSCYVGWIVADWGQSDNRALGGDGGNIAGVPAVTALHDNRVRFVTLARAGQGNGAVTADELNIYDIAGESPSSRAPVWAMANVLMRYMTDGPIVLMGHAVSGSPDRSVIDDSVDHRYWQDEVTILTAGQPHLIDRERPVVIDVARWAWSSAAKYGSGVSLDLMGRYLFGLETDGSPATRDSSHGSSGQAYTLNHMWSDIYDWNAGARLTLSGQFSIEDETIAHNIFEDHPVYGPYCLGFPVGLPRYGVVKGAQPPSWADIAHPSQFVPHGANRALAIEAESMARALGLTDPPMFFDWIDWGDGEEDDKRYVHVGIDGHDVTTLRYELDPEEEPGAFGQVLNFVLNGANVRDATLVTFKGQRRVRLQKPGLAEWNGADLLTMTSGPGVAETNEERDTLFQLDWPCTPSSIPELLATPLSQWTTTAPTLFDNPLPAPSGLPEPEHVGDYTYAATINSDTAQVVASIESDGSPLIIFVAARNNVTGTNALSAATLGGVGILGSAFVNASAGAIRIAAFRVASPASETLDLSITSPLALRGVTVQAFKEPAGMGSVQASGGGTFGASATIGMLGSSDVATADNTTVLAMAAWTQVVTLEGSTALPQLPESAGGFVQVNPVSDRRITMFGLSGVVNNAGGAGTATASESATRARAFILWNPPA